MGNLGPVFGHYGVGGDVRLEGLECHIPVQPGVPGAVDLPHAALAELLHNPVVE